MIRVLIVEDQGLFRDMLRISLSSYSNLEIVDAVATGEEALKAFRELKPEVVLMDIELGDGPSGIETGRVMNGERTETGIVLLSVHKDKEYISSLSVEEASGWSYLLKQSVGDASALRRAMRARRLGSWCWTLGLSTT